jgi:uncharacterized protein DUF6868
MTVELVRDVLGWCTAINFGLLIVWFLSFICAHDLVYRLHTKWFKLSVEKFDAIHYVSIGFCKFFILLFNLAPYLALRIVA